MSDWLNEFVRCDAIWLHDGNARRPHALLTSGMHSNGFVNCTKIVQQPSLVREILSREDGLKRKLPRENVDWVIGSAMGAVTFAFAVAGELDARAGFTESAEGEVKLARFEIPPGARVLVVEDVISTGGSTQKTIAAIGKATREARILPFILCLVNRSAQHVLDGREIRALIEPEIHAWKPEECPLCKQGSEAVRPKSHWRELTGWQP